MKKKQKITYQNMMKDILASQKRVLADNDLFAFATLLLLERFLRRQQRANRQRSPSGVSKTSNSARSSRKTSRPGKSEAWGSKARHGILSNPKQKKKIQKKA
jgi:hypothetical protein